jgi:DNA helicase II / ATP-dependent DNA helicase PcrA
MQTPTPEQAAIINFACNSNQSMLINALAGSAKTTTLCMIAQALPIQPILSLAFNKKIAEEMASRLSGHVTCKTMNAIGHGIWAKTCVSRLSINPRKSYELLKANVEALSKAERAEAYETFSETLKAIAQAKREGYLPKTSLHHAKGHESFWAGFDEAPSGLQRTLIDKTLSDSITAAYNGQLDFDDQLYMPTLFGGSFPRFPLVLVDEAQDLSPINHAMLRKLVVDRFIGVGDPWQSIYGFRGAVQGGMGTLAREFSCKEFTLSVSFRCPQAIVEAARIRVPHMKWNTGGGHVQTLDRLGIEDIPDGAAFICRCNAPLFNLALKLLVSGRGASLVGTDLGPALIRTLKKLGPETLSKKEVYHAISAWEAERLLKAKDKSAISDIAECLRVFAEFGQTLGTAITYAEHIFKSQGTIQLLSGHKAKGLEWDTVYHLDPWRIPSPYAETPEEIAQELNLSYVITTRAKHSLFFIDLQNIEASSAPNLRASSTH